MIESKLSCGESWPSNSVTADPSASAFTTGGLNHRRRATASAAAVRASHTCLPRASSATPGTKSSLTKAGPLVVDRGQGSAVVLILDQHWLPGSSDAILTD